MANWVFKLKGLGTDAAVVLQLGLNDSATTRALDKHRLPQETNEQVVVRLWTAWFEENVTNVDYIVRKNTALTAAAAGISKAVPTVSSTET